MSVYGRLSKCMACEKPLLVEQFLFGVSHTDAIHVTCWDCLTEGQKREAVKRYGVERPDEKVRLSGPQARPKRRRGKDGA